MMPIERRQVLLGGAAGMVAAGMNPALALARAAPDLTGIVDVQRFGAKGDGVALDSPAINKAIDHVAARGGGTVWLPPGTYRSFTIRMKSAVTLHLSPGAVLLAADWPGTADNAYDHAEPMDPVNATYQDFGHSHWRNSLIWGEGLHDIGITGSGLIWGKGLGRGDGKDQWLKDPSGPGTANKAIALKNCRNVILRDLRMLEGGWFAILLTGVDNLTIDNLLIDTNRDGIDIDCCKNVRVSNCTVNSPWDDAICPKSSHALGYPRVTENVTIENCFVSGNYQVGAVLDGSWRKMPPDFAKDIHGRIKFGTETNGGFRNIVITNCVFEDSRGLAFQTVDGGVVEDVTVSNLTMRGIINAPFFLRLGKRMRGPAGRELGSMRRILIQNVSSSGANVLPSVIAGLDERRIEDLHFSNVRLHHVGGAPAAMAALEPVDMPLGYPEATMFGDLPAHGFYVRNVTGLQMADVAITTDRPDPRPAMWLENVSDADLFRFTASGSPLFRLRNIERFRDFGTPQRAERRLTAAADLSL